MSAIESGESSRESAKREIQRLARHYREVLDSGKAGDFVEAQVRISFIDPLLKALGWNIEAPEEVTVEERVLEGHCDYALRVLGERRPRVFIEAKRFELGPKGLDGQTERGGRPLTFPQQAIRYAWQSQADWAVLTNFRETRLYSAYVDPKDPEQGLNFAVLIEDLEESFDKLWLLSKESVQLNRLDALPKRRTRETIHEEAPEDLLECRANLATDIHRNEPSLKPVEIQGAAQRILDRLIVMRAAEDRGILPAETLSTLHSTWKKTLIDPSSLFIRSLRNQFDQFDHVYNSEMFAPGHVCDRVRIGNDAIDKVLATLYEYNFDLIDADILGSIYEGYLSYVLEDVGGAITFRTEKAVRKRHGVYYTPTYVVEYIVDQALGPLLTTADRGAISQVRLLDPACGSGSFLIKAFDRFADAHARVNAETVKTGKGRRTLEEHSDRLEEVHNYREEILRTNLFGVDLDGQAAEIAAINLMLKALRPGQKLPLILKENVRVGNSLISGSDTDLASIFGPGRSEIHPFRWSEEFPQIVSSPMSGFDVVVGNPPYVDSKAIPEPEREYFHGTRGGRLLPFPTAYKKSDLYTLFLELGIRLLRPGGRLAFIVPDKVLTAPYASKLRPFILDTCQIEQILDLSAVRVFPHQTVRNVILVLRKESDKSRRDSHVVSVGVVPSGTDLSKGIPEPTERMPQSIFHTVPGYQFRLELRDRTVLATALKFQQGTVPLDELFYVNWGLRTGTSEKTEHLITATVTGPESKPLLRGEDIVDRYLIERGRQFVTYLPGELVNPLFPEALGSPKIVIRKISGNKGLFGAYDDDGAYPFSTVILVLPFHAIAHVPKAKVSKEDAERSKQFNPRYVLSVLNSRAMRFYYDAMISDHLGVVPNHVNQLPIPQAPPEIQSELASLTEQLVALYHDLAEENRIGSFRNVLASYPRAGHDDLGQYLGKLDESRLEVRDRLDQVSRGQRITIAATTDDDALRLVLRFSYKPHEALVAVDREGTVVCRLEPEIASFLARVISDRESPGIGTGEPMRKLRAVEIPRFDEDWDHHLSVVREIMAAVGRHEVRIRELSAQAHVAEEKIDTEVYRLFGLDEGDVRVIQDYTARLDLLVGASEGAKGRRRTDGGPR